MKEAISFSSGGKDSVLSLHIAHSDGLEISSMMTMIPEDPESMLYHTHNVHLVEKIANSIDVEWIPITAPKDQELESLTKKLIDMNKDYLITGGIESMYQKKKFDLACKNANMIHYSPLWGIQPKQLYDKILEYNLDVIIVSVAAYGLDQEWLGRHLDKFSIQELLSRADKYNFNAVGEGGDLDSLVLDGPLYRKKLQLKTTTKIWNGDHGHLEITEIDELSK